MNLFFFFLSSLSLPGGSSGAVGSRGVFTFLHSPAAALSLIQSSQILRKLSSRSLWQPSSFLGCSSCFSVYANNFFASGARISYTLSSELHSFFLTLLGVGYDTTSLIFNEKDIDIVIDVRWWKSK